MGVGSLDSGTSLLGERASKGAHFKFEGSDLKATLDLPMLEQNGVKFELG
jgi:hypothetical protein